MDTALLLLDLQNDIVDPKGKFGAAGMAELASKRNVVANAARALTAARARGQYVVFVRLGFRADYADALSTSARVAHLKSSGAAVFGTWAAEFPDEIAPLPGEMIFTKQCVNPFFNTGLMNWLLRMGVTKLALGGMATNMVVDSAARAADDAGFTCTILEDVCAAKPELHEAAIKLSLPLFATISTVDEFYADS